MNAPWQLDVLWGVVNGLTTGAISVPLAAIIANRWFTARRGLVTGVLTAASATGHLIFLPVLASIVGGLGWRYAAVTVTVVALAIVLAGGGLPPRPARRSRARALRLERGRAGSCTGTQPVRGRGRGASRKRARARRSGSSPAASSSAAFDERADRHPPDPCRDGPRDGRGRRRKPARSDRDLRHRRDDVLGLAHRPPRPARPARLVLRPARAVACSRCRTHSAHRTSA